MMVPISARIEMSEHGTPKRKQLGRLLTNPERGRVAAVGRLLDRADSNDSHVRLIMAELGFRIVDFGKTGRTKLSESGFPVPPMVYIIADGLAAPHPDATDLVLRKGADRDSSW